MFLRFIFVENSEKDCRVVEVLSLHDSALVPLNSPQLLYGPALATGMSFGNIWGKVCGVESGVDA